MSRNDAGEIPFHVRRSRRARRLRIDVSRRDGVVVVVPEAASDAVIRRFVAGKQSWLERTLRRVGANPLGAQHAPARPPDRLHLPALDRSFDVSVSAEGAQRAERDGDRVRLQGASDADTERMLLARWLQRMGRQALLPWLERTAAATGLTYERAAVRGQRTRWGSCSGRGTISLNYKLLFLEPRLVEHVLRHELAHTRHLNHAQAFWRLLARLDPDWRRNHAALKAAEDQLPAWLDAL